MSSCDLLDVVECVMLRFSKLFVNDVVGRSICNIAVLRFSLPYTPGCHRFALKHKHRMMYGLYRSCMLRVPYIASPWVTVLSLPCRAYIDDPVYRTTQSLSGVHVAFHLLRMSLKRINSITILYTRCLNCDETLAFHQHGD
jgi:hypothetical protein